MALRFSLGPIVASTLAAGLALLLPATAEAHVKWFCAFQIAGQPDGLRNVLCQDFEKLLALGIGVLFLGCLVDRTFIGDALTRALDRITAPLRDQGDVMVRACVGFYLVSVWCLGGVLLTPELTTTSTVVPWIQLAMAACLLSRQTTIITAVGIVGMFATAVWNYGAFHLADYPVFLGIAAYLAAFSLGKTILGARPIDVLRWSAAVTLMWASVEKWAYPEWSYPLFVTHPDMAMGFDPAYYMRAAGVVEFSMSFALIWTPLVRRCGAIMLAGVFISAIAGFGKVDAIGHAPIIAVLFAIIADDAKQVVRAKISRLALMPVVYCAALASFVTAYYGLHAAMFGTQML